MSKQVRRSSQVAPPAGDAPEHRRGQEDDGQQRATNGAPARPHERSLAKAARHGRCGAGAEGTKAS